MAVAISSLPSIRCSNQTWIYTSKLEIYSMAPAQLQTNIRHSRVWLWGRAKVPINSKSGSRAAVDRGGKCVFGNLTMSLSSERSTAAGSAHPLVIVTDGSGHSSTSPPPEIHTHHKKKTGWVFYSAPGHEVAPEERFWNPNTSHSIPDCSQNTNLYESAIWSRSGENLALPQMSAFQDLRKTAFFWTCSAMLLCFFFFF